MALSDVLELFVCRAVRGWSQGSFSSQQRRRFQHAKECKTRAAGYCIFCFCDDGGLRKLSQPKTVDRANRVLDLELVQLSPMRVAFGSLGDVVACLFRSAVGRCELAVAYSAVAVHLEVG